MKIIKQFSIIILISLISEGLYYILPFPIPAGIYGLLIMFVLLLSGIIKIESVNDTGQFLLDIMPIMFIPAVIGLLGTLDELREFLFAFIVITILSTTFVMILSGKITQKIIDRGNRNK